MNKTSVKGEKIPNCTAQAWGRNASQPCHAAGPTCHVLGVRVSPKGQLHPEADLSSASGPTGRGV